LSHTFTPFEAISVTPGIRVNGEQQSLLSSLDDTHTSSDVQTAWRRFIGPLVCVVSAVRIPITMNSPETITNFLTITMFIFITDNFSHKMLAPMIVLVAICATVT
jgi:hypothetical protein